MTETETDWAEKIGKPAYGSIAEMVAALECDYDRLEELRDDRDGFDEFETWPTDGGLWHVAKSGGLPVFVEGAYRWDKKEARKIADRFNREAWAEANPDDAEELKELEDAAGECESQEDAATRISEDPLSVRIFGERVEGEWEADKAEVLLSTGGPAVRIMCEFGDHAEPRRAWLEVQDWFKPWTQYYPADQDTLLTYCRQFCFE